MSQFVFKMRAAQADRTGYYYTRWDQATPIEVVAASKKEALNKAEAVLGEPRTGRYWSYMVDKIVDVAAAE